MYLNAKVATFTVESVLLIYLSFWKFCWISVMCF